MRCLKPLLFLLLAGCAQLAVSPEKALEERAKVYWQAREAGDFQTLYKMESAALPGGWLKPYMMARLAGLPVSHVTIGKVSVEGDEGKVEVTADVTIPSMRAGVFRRSTIIDRWVRIDGVWYHKTFDPSSLTGGNVKPKKATP